MANAVSSIAAPSPLGESQRKDAWWVGPAVTAFVLLSFVIYATFRGVYNADYQVVSPDSAHILSPFYSPLIVWPGMPSWLSPAFLILWAPGGFRVTCYYYRKAYYRALFLNPPGCAVGKVGLRYKGESFLLLFQNLHRFFLYFALLLVPILSYDVWMATQWPDGFGISVATLVLAVNTFLLTMYTFSCHSFRHLIGGNVDCFSCVAMGDARHAAWKGVSKLNQLHMNWAWMSLFGVALSDLYVWLIASGTITDFRIL